MDYFSTMPSLHRTLLLVGGLTVFWLLESAAPLFRFRYVKWQHALVNIFFTLTTIAVNFSLAFVLVRTADLVTERQFGVLYLMDLPLWVFALIGLMLMDLIGAYLIHFLEHKVKWMWRFHMVHHTDQHVDTTSANRHHPGESVFRFVFTTLAVVIIGAPMWLVMVYQSLSVVLTQFNHSNMTMPPWLDRALGVVFCTPNIHRVHHHYRQPYTDSNYGNIFSFWDRLFGTFVQADNQKLVYGLDTHMDAQASDSVLHMLKMPFLPYRKPVDYEQPEQL